MIDSLQVASTCAEGYRQLHLNAASTNGGGGGGGGNGSMNGGVGEVVGGVSSFSKGVNGNNDDVTTFEDGSTQLFRLSELVDVDRLSLIQRLIRQVGRVEGTYLTRAYSNSIRNA